ncbi:tyrosine-type recombinase/integrase [Endozoicomonas ascidiicola]|uniref:tyrosine-type recombinase/integrase n=1 Tax=Endozoicomonas ascidiicola TaxID=1698521 RepID=UPI00082F3A27|nr:phage integrase SAM-like domain-containing protein [Endozoicomonas ascidiicola]
MARALYFYDPKSQNYIGEFPHDPEVGFVASRRGIRRKLCNAADVEHLSNDQTKNYVWEIYLQVERELRNKQLRKQREKEEKQRAKKKLSVSTALELWEAELKAFGKSADTVSNYTRSVKLYLEAVEDHPLREFDRDCNVQFYKFLASRPKDKHSSEPLSPATQNKHMRHLSAFLAWAKKSEFIDKKHLLEKARVPDKDMDTYEVADLTRARQLLEKRLAEYTRPKDIIAARNMLRAFMVATQTILRLGAIWSLPLSAIDMKRRVIRIQEVKALGWVPKKMKFPNKPINDTLFKFLQQDLASRSPREKWFLDKGDGSQWHLDKSNISHYAAALFKELGLPRIKPFHHAFRATMIGCSLSLITDS